MATCSPALRANDRRSWMDTSAFAKEPDCIDSRQTRFPTGMFPLDDVLDGGFRRQDLVLITGRPGAGKTVMALQWARAVARQGADRVETNPKWPARGPSADPQGFCRPRPVSDPHQIRRWPVTTARLGQL